jgi:hypothetical protein
MANERTEDIRTPEFRGSFVHLFQVEKKPDGSDGMFSVNALFPKVSADWKTDLPWLVENLKAALQIQWPGFNGMPPAFQNTLVGKPWPVSDGDAPNTMGNIQEAHKGHWVVRMASKNFTAERNLCKINAQNQSEPVLEAECFSGCYFQAIVNSYVYVRQDGCGVNVGLNNVLFTRTGESLGGGGGQDAASAFGVAPAAVNATAAFAPVGAAPASAPVGSLDPAQAAAQAAAATLVPAAAPVAAAPSADWLS